MRRTGFQPKAPLEQPCVQDDFHIPLPWLSQLLICLLVEIPCTLYGLGSAIKGKRSLLEGISGLVACGTT